MTHVVTGPCIGCKCACCAEMCPVHAFHEGQMMLYIDPEACIDCGACRGQCLRGAIFSAAELPEVWQQYGEINRRQAAVCPPITEPQDPLGFPLWECTLNRPQLNADSVA